MIVRVIVYNDSTVIIMDGYMGSNCDSNMLNK